MDIAFAVSIILYVSKLVTIMIEFLNFIVGFHNLLFLNCYILKENRAFSQMAKGAVFQNVSENLFPQLRKALC